MDYLERMKRYPHDLEAQTNVMNHGIYWINYGPPFCPECESEDFDWIKTEEESTWKAHHTQWAVIFTCNKCGCVWSCERLESMIL